MPDPNLVVGPQEPDGTSDLGSIAAGNSALRLFRLHADNHPVPVMAALAKRVDEERTKALDYDEIRELLEDELPEDSKVHSAWVRGVDASDREVTVTYLLPSGRSAKALIPDYGSLPRSVKSYEGNRRLFLTTSGPVALGDADATGEESADVERLRKHAADLEDELAAARGEGPPEPYEGFSDAKVEDVEARIELEPEGFDREYLKRRIRDAEEQSDRPRQGVLAATEPVDLVPASAEQPGG